MTDTILYDNMKTVPKIRSHFYRQRITNLLSESLKYPTVTVTAGAGYGKTQEVSAFLSETNVPFIWMSLSKLDNLTARFWESFIYAVSVLNPKLASSFYSSDFPNSAAQFHDFLHKFANIITYLNNLVLIFDDFHFIHESSIIQFIENLLNAQLKNMSVLLISRKQPELIFQGLHTGGLIFQITEDDLRFTKKEAADYFKTKKIELSPTTFDAVYKCTEGWISALYLMSLSLEKHEKVDDYAFFAAKQHIFQLIDQEIFSGYSLEIQKILIKLSLFEEFSLDIIKEFSEDNWDLINNIEQTNLFIRYNPVTKTYRFHHLFSDFLSNKKILLPQEELKETYLIMGNRYDNQGSKIDAIKYYQLGECPEKIWNIIRHYEVAMPKDIANLFLELIEGFPEDLKAKNPLIPVVHARLLLNNNKFKESLQEFSAIIKSYELLPSTAENNAIMGESYLFMGLMSLLNFDYKFTEFFKAADRCLPNGSTLIDDKLSFSDGNYLVLVKNPVRGEYNKFIDAYSESMPYMVRAMNGSGYGIKYAAIAEAAYYTCDMKTAESSAYKAIHHATKNQQYDTVCAAYFILIQIYINSGNYVQAEDCLKKMTEITEDPAPEKAPYVKNCICTRDILKGWYYSRLQDTEKIPDWILKIEKRKQNVTPNHLGRDQFIHAYCLLEAENHHELSALLGVLEDYYNTNGLLPARIEVQIFKSIAAYKSGNVSESMDALQIAYELSHANFLFMPFIELGKYMRTVIYAAKRYENLTIPVDFLDTVYTKSSTYSKRLNSIRAQHRRSLGLSLDNPHPLTKREKEILRQLCQGLSREEIANTLFASESTVKQSLKNIYSKLGAKNRVDAVRIAIQMGFDK